MQTGLSWPALSVFLATMSAIAGVFWWAWRNFTKAVVERLDKQTKMLRDIHRSHFQRYIRVVDELNRCVRLLRSAHGELSEDQLPNEIPPAETSQLVDLDS